MSGAQRTEGYGTSIEFDGSILRLIAGKTQAKIWRTEVVEIPVADLISVKYRAANSFVNGRMVFDTTQPANSYARDSGGFVPDNGLVIHWRRKDQPAFEQLHTQLVEIIDRRAVQPVRHVPEPSPVERERPAPAAAPVEKAPAAPTVDKPDAEANAERTAAAAAATAKAEERTRAADARAAERSAAVDARAAEKSAAADAKAERKAAEKAEKARRKAEERTHMQNNPFALFGNGVVGGGQLEYNFVKYDLTDATAEATMGAPSSRSTFTRMGAGALIAGPAGFIVGAVARKDTGKCYVTIQLQDRLIVLEGPSKTYPAAVRFADAVNRSSRA